MSREIMEGNIPFCYRISYDPIEKAFFVFVCTEFVKDLEDIPNTD